MAHRLILGAAACAAAIISLVPAQHVAADNTMYICHGGFNNGDPYGGELGIVNMNNWNYTSLGMPVSDAGLTGLAFYKGMLYASTSNSTLAIIDCDGDLYDEFPFFGSGYDHDKNGDRVTDLTVDKKGRMYAHARTSSDGDALYRVDPSTAELTYVGVLPTNGYTALAARNNRMYAHRTNGPGSYHEVNPSDASSMEEISGGVPGGALGMGYNSDDGWLWASECCDGDDDAFGERIYRVNPNNGNHTLMHDYDDDRKIHDIEFVPDYAAVNGYQVKYGEHFSGNKHSVGKSDNKRLEVDAEPRGNKYQSQTIIKMTSPCRDISRLDLRVETGTNKNNVKTTVHMYDFNSNRWRVIDRYPQSRSDSSMYFPNISSPNRFVRESDGLMRVRLTSIRRDGMHRLEIDYVRADVEH